MINKHKLEYHRKIKELSVEELSKKIGISPTAYYRKINGKSEFNRAEIEKLIKELDLNEPLNIFFNFNLS